MLFRLASGDGLADRLRVATVEAGERGAFLEDIAVSTSASVGICGNGVCESADCDSDCPLKGHFVCPGDDASTGAHCAGHGRCMRGNIQGEGICDERVWVVKTHWPERAGYRRCS